MPSSSNSSGSKKGSAAVLLNALREEEGEYSYDGGKSPQTSTRFSYVEGTEVNFYEGVLWIMRLVCCWLYAWCVGDNNV